MKLKHLAYLSLAAGAVLGASAQAQNTIRFTGSVSLTTCTISVNGFGANRTLGFGVVNPSQFPSPMAAGNVSPITISLALTDCAPTTNVFAHFYRNLTSAWSPYSDLISSDTSVLGNVGNWLNVQILTSGGTPTPVNFSDTIPANPARHTNDPIVTTDAAGSATLVYTARLFRGPASVPVGPGTFSTQAGYIINYD